MTKLFKILTFLFICTLLYTCSNTTPMYYLDKIPSQVDRWKAVGWDCEITTLTIINKFNTAANGQIFLTHDLFSYVLEVVPYNVAANTTITIEVKPGMYSAGVPYRRAAIKPCHKNRLYV